ncbi:tyrosine-protein phosphatase [Novosphingobium pokkalii]|uniref:Tyrosine-protein phosphatase n=1 Tax=Novosphingobium pokkalii TaxID=1770194 RepID=A0ABV7UYJ9_9SPHN|nr:tyrosine-protein phosphatase [Novosphingobium pokkalii]GHC95611.1 tyrosine phosphatase [Novosphingobium pokkalii]
MRGQRALSLGLGLALAASPCLAPTAFARAQQAIASRVDGRTLVADWQARGPVDVYLATRPDGPLAQARLIARGVRSGHATVRAGTSPRPYLRLRDRADGTVVTVAERWLPLAQGSNFRDLGGYPAADGKTVRWGLIYRAGATPLLTPADVAQVRGLGLATMVDLRSDEERRLAPTRLAGQVHQDAVPYSMMALFAGAQGGKMPSNGGALYRQFPTLLAPQVRLVFDRLKAQAGPIEYNCSAGQDRTGFMTALILAALGTPRAVILRDYDLSTALRRPEWEMPKIDAAKASDPVAKMFAGYQANPAMARPQPLHDPDGRPFLASAMDEIDARYGSVEGYLEKVAGVTAADIAMLRKAYTE